MSCCGPSPHDPTPPTNQPCCPSRWRDSRLCGLPTRTKMKLVGTCRDEFVEFPPAPRGTQQFLVLDEFGNAIPTTNPQVNIPLLRNILLDNGMPATNPDGSYVEQIPPPFNAMLVTQCDGTQNRIRGTAGQVQRVQWDGCKFNFIPDSTDLTLEDLIYIGPTHGYCDTLELVLVQLPDGTVQMGYRSKPSLPVGTIMMWGGAKNALPAGWIVCEGQALDKNTYPDLFTAWGYSAGGSGNTFYAIDARGRYPRGVDDGAGIDPNAGTRTANQSGGNIGDKVFTYGTGTDTTATAIDFGVFFIAFAGCIKS
jgi:hypothetical protein